MSIWSSVEGEEIRVLENSTDAANYRGNGDPGLVVDVATATTFHDRIRLAIWSDSRTVKPPAWADADVDVLLSPAAARELRRKLGVALGDPG